MNHREQYELDILGMCAVLLTRWKWILKRGLMLGLVLLAVILWSSQAPRRDELEYRQLRSAIQERKLEEEHLRLAREKFDNNLFYRMEPEAIVTRRLTAAVILEDQSLVHDRADPADLALYAYYDLALTQLQGEVLVPSVLTKAQQEQLLTIALDLDTNVLTISVTTDEKPLADGVLEAAARWYRDTQPMVAAQTYPHRLEILTPTEAVYTREERALLVSSAAAEAELRASELKIAQHNETIENLFLQKPGWAATQTAEALDGLLQEKRQQETRPSVLLPGLCPLLGLALTMAWMGAELVLKGRLLGEAGVGAVTGWTYIGRLWQLPGKDPVAAAGERLLYTSPAADREALAREAREMMALLLKDRGLREEASIALIGTLPEERLTLAAEAMENGLWRIQTASLCAGRVKAGKLCRKADAVIFAADADAVTMADTDRLAVLLEILDRKPLGYILV